VHRGQAVYRPSHFSISLFKPVHDSFHGVREQVGVGIEGRSCGRVSEVVLNRLDVCPARNEKRCTGMAEVMDPEVTWDPRSPNCWRPEA